MKNKNIKICILTLIILLIFPVFLFSSTNNINKSEFEKYRKYNNITKYDTYFIKYSKQYFSVAFDWRNFKSQSIAESGLNPEAKSPVGAQGIMQIMPLTYNEIRNKNKFVSGSVFDPKYAIPAGIYYDSTLFNSKLLTPKKTLQDKIDYMMGSYNAGLGNIYKSQKECIEKKIDDSKWDCVMQTLPLITGNFSKETFEYVRRIKGIKEILK